MSTKTIHSDLHRAKIALAINRGALHRWEDKIIAEREIKEAKIEGLRNAVEALENVQE